MLTTLLAQMVMLGMLSMPVAAISWTVTHEEIFREPREYCRSRSRDAPSWWLRKLSYMVTCEYCFSHWVSLAVVAVTGFWMVYPDWRGHAVAWLSLVCVANVYMTVFVRLRLEVKEERLEIATLEAQQDRSDAPPEH